MTGWISIGIAGLSIIFTFVVTQKIKNNDLHHLEASFKEDKDKNNEQHKEFYTKLDNLEIGMAEVRTTLKERKK